MKQEKITNNDSNYAEDTESSGWPINRRSLLKATAAASVFGTGFRFSVGSATANGSGFPCSQTLYAAQDIEVGWVEVRSNGEVEYNIDTSGWTITETHLHIDESPDSDGDEIPVNGGGNPQLGNFEHVAHYDPGVTNVIVREDEVEAGGLIISGADGHNWAGGTDCIDVAAHAVVEKCDSANEALYLSDSGLDGNASDNDGASLYSVDLDETNDEAVLTHLVDMDVATGGNDWYDQVDAIAARNDAKIFAIDRYSKHLGIYDISADSFTDQGVVSGLPDGVVQCVISPAGELWVASDVTDNLHRIDISAPAVVETVDVDDDFEFLGADIVFDAQGRLFIFTNGGDSTNGVGLYKIDDISASQPISPDFIGTPVRPYFTGLAIRGAGFGDLVGSAHMYDEASSNNTTIFDPSDPDAANHIFTIDHTDGTRINTYDAVDPSGNTHNIGYGDMTVGELCDEFLDETAWADGTRFTEKGNWATHFYCPEDCHEEEEGGPAPLRGGNN